jgi:cysteine-rich repeat protein
MGAWNHGDEPNLCRDDCTMPFCGDGIYDNLHGEECDDDNQRNNDGCSDACQQEPLYCCEQFTLAGVAPQPEDEAACLTNKRFTQREVSRGSDCQLSCDQSVCNTCNDGLFGLICLSTSCMNLGCEPAELTVMGSFFSLIGNPSGLESYSCQVSPACPL